MGPAQPQQLMVCDIWFLDIMWLLCNDSYRINHMNGCAYLISRVAIYDDLAMSRDIFFLFHLVCERVLDISKKYA